MSSSSFGLCRGNRRDRGHIDDAGRTVVVGLKTSTGLAAPDDQLVDGRLLEFRRLMLPPTFKTMDGTTQSTLYGKFESGFGPMLDKM
jgi:hypothetical protein